MVIIRRIYLGLLFSFCLLAIVGLGLQCYYFFIQLNPRDQLSIKYYAENLLFVAAALAVILILLFLWILSRSVSVYHELDKIADLAQTGNYAFGKQAGKLGTLGRYIISISAHLKQLNEMKSYKLSAQASLIKFLMDNTRLKLILFNAHGNIDDWSPVFLQEFDLDENDLRGKTIENLVDELNLPLLLSEMKMAKRFGIRKNISFTPGGLIYNRFLVFYPVFDLRNELSVGLMSVEDEEIFHQSRVQSATTATAPSTPGLSVSGQQPAARSLRDVFLMALRGKKQDKA